MVLLADLLPPPRCLAEVAHPDDESFGLGALLAALVASGSTARALCLTHGEASTLGAADELGALRQAELAEAARRLCVGEVDLDDSPDGGLTALPHGVLDEAVERWVGDAVLFVVFDPGGVTGHPDHRTASASAERVAARRGLPILERGVPPDVAATLRAELGVPFVALDGPGVSDVTVDRDPQWTAIAAHVSQATDTPVLGRRLALQGDRERVRLRRATLNQ